MRKNIRKTSTIPILQFFLLQSFSVAFVMTVMRILLGPALVPEDLQPVLVVPAERPEVGQHLVHELNVARGAGVTDLLPSFRDHEIPRPQKSCKSFLIVVIKLRFGQIKLVLMSYFWRSKKCKVTSFK